MGLADGNTRPRTGGLAWWRAERGAAVPLVALRSRVDRLAQCAMGAGTPWHPARRTAQAALDVAQTMDSGDSSGLDGGRPVRPDASPQRERACAAKTIPR